MKDHQRIAIVDRSVLAQNIYATLLRPVGFSLFPFKTLRELKEKLLRQWGVQLFLINTNTFGHHLERHLDWLQTHQTWGALPKIFLCGPSEKKVLQNLKKIPNSHIVLRPFYPLELEKKICESL